MLETVRPADLDKEPETPKEWLQKQTDYFFCWRHRSHQRITACIKRQLETPRYYLDYYDELTIHPSFAICNNPKCPLFLSDEDVEMLRKQTHREVVSADESDLLIAKFVSKLQEKIQVSRYRGPYASSRQT